MPCGAEVLKGGVVYTVESAREEAFSQVQYTIPMEEHQKYLSDPGFQAREGKKPKISKRGRYVTHFSDGTYAVKYCGKLDIAYYYNIYGKLEEIEYKKHSGYPYLSQKYDMNGKLVEVFFNVNKDESFVYNADKSLSAHWIKDKCYDLNGNVIYKRN